MNLFFRFLAYAEREEEWEEEEGEKKKSRKWTMEARKKDSSNEKTQ